MWSYVNSALLFLLSLIWSLVFLLLMLTAISLLCRCLKRRHRLRKSRCTKYTSVLIEEGRGDITVDTINQENSNVEEENRQEKNRMLQEDDKRDLEPKDVKAEETGEVSNGTKNCKYTFDEKVELHRKSDSNDGREKEIELSNSSIIGGEVKESKACVSDERVTTEGKLDTTPEVDTSHLPDEEHVSTCNTTDYQQEVLNDRCNMRKLKNCELSKSTDEALARPVPTPRRKIKPGDSQSELSCSQASLIDRSEDDEAVVKNPGKTDENIKRESASPRPNSPLFDDLESMFPFSKELEKDLLASPIKAEICTGASVATMQESCKSHDKDSTQDKITLSSEREQDMGTFQNDIEPSAVEKIDGTIFKGDVTPNPTPEKDKTNARKVLNEAQKKDSATSSDVSTLVEDLSAAGAKSAMKLTPEDATAHLESNKSDICASKLPPLPTSLPKRGRKAKKNATVGESKICKMVNQQEKLVGATGGTSMIEMQSEQQCDKSTDTTKPEHTQLLSPKSAKSNGKSTITAPNRSRKGSKKPSNPPPIPPSSPLTKEITTTASLMRDAPKGLEPPEVSSPLNPKDKSKSSEESASLVRKVSGSRKIAKPGHAPPSPPKKTSDPSPTLKLDSSTTEDTTGSAVSSIPYTQIPTIPVKSQPVYDEIGDKNEKQPTDKHICDEAGNKSMVTKMLSHRPGVQGAVVENANILNFQKQALRQVNMRTNQFVNPVFEIAAGIQEKQQNNQSGGDTATKKVLGGAQYSGFGPPKPPRVSSVLTPDMVVESSSSDGLSDAIHKGTDICTSVANGSTCSAINTRPCITPLASNEDPSICDVIPEVPGNPRTDTKKLMQHDKQLSKPPLPSKPKVLREPDTALQGACQDREKIKTNKAHVPKKPFRKT